MNAVFNITLNHNVILIGLQFLVSYFRCLTLCSLMPSYSAWQEPAATVFRGVGSFEMSLTTYQTTEHYIPRDSSINNHCNENFVSHKVLCLPLRRLFSSFRIQSEGTVSLCSVGTHLPDYTLS